MILLNRVREVDNINLKKLKLNKLVLIDALKSQVVEKFKSFQIKVLIVIYKLKRVTFIL